MVTRHTLHKRSGPWVVCAAVAAMALILAIGGAPRDAYAQEKNLYFLTPKTGDQTVGGGTLFETLEADHGALRDSRSVTRTGFDFDIYAVTPHKYGIGVNVEIMDYSKTFHFSNPGSGQTPEYLHLDARSVLYTLEAFLRFGDFLPFVGVGSGTYYVSYNEEISQLSFIDSSNSVFAYRAGFRWLLVGRIGLLAETGTISALLHVTSNNTNTTLNLGGDFANVGLFYVW